jgi:hypothetical protein
MNGRLKTNIRTKGKTMAQTTYRRYLSRTSSRSLVNSNTEEVSVCSERENSSGCPKILDLIDFL